VTGKRTCWLLCFLICARVAPGQSNAPAAVPASAAAAVAVSPQLFALGVISGPANDGSPTFSPDGKTLFFTRSTATWGVILESHRAHDKWSEPEVAPFSGEYSDSSPGMAPDGSFIVFVSLRPKDSAAPTDPSHQPQRLANLWRSNRVGSGWSKPMRMPDAVNIGSSIWKPSIASDGTIYFVSIDAKGGKRLYSAQYKDGAYQQAQPLSFSNGTTADVDPEIAPDGSFLVFCSSGRRNDDPKDHLFVVMRKGADWGPVMPIRYEGDDQNGSSIDDEPHLGPDHRTLYFSSDRTVHVNFPRTAEQARRDLKRLELWDNSNSNVWFMPITPWLNAAGAN
jgi:Tol biopolymer transport system component